jgi:glycosyltransferase involved in cell wall biosynthesis
MRIAYVSGDLGVPVFGTKGASIHLRELARTFRSLGHEVLILATRAGGQAPAGFDIPVCEIPTTNGSGSEASRELRAVRGAGELRRRGRAPLFTFGPDVIYERLSLFGSAGVSLAAALDVPILVEVNAPLSQEQAKYRGLGSAERAEAVERAVLRAADRVIAVSGWLRRWLVNLGVEPRRVAVVPNGVDPERFDAAAGERDAIRARLGVDGRPLVGFVGTLKPWHDVSTLIRAVAHLRRTSLAPELLIIGDGRERPRLEQLARDEGVVEAVTFTGAVPHERVPAFLSALDVAVAPYRPDDDFYFSPLKLVECLAAARPVVAADVGEIGHCVRPDETGVLYPAGDVSALSGAIRRLLEDRDRAARLGRAGREHVRAEHTWIGNARTIVGLAVEALARSGGRR